MCMFVTVYVVGGFERLGWMWKWAGGGRVRGSVGVKVDGGRCYIFHSTKQILLRFKCACRDYTVPISSIIACLH